MLDHFTTFAMLLIGIIVGVIMVYVGQILGFSGWVVGPIFCGLVLAFIYINDRLMAFSMRHVIIFLAKSENTKYSDNDKKEIDRNFSKRIDYYGFFVGCVVGVLVGLFLGPSVFFDLISL